MSENKVTQLTPMMQQYCSIKEQYEDFLLFYRLGDFYELFFEDAKLVSKELGLVLTKRVDIPMCGIPWHASEMYLTKLVKNGHRIAICEQLETPEEARIRGGSKATVERAVTRIITQGTIVEQAMLSEKSNNFLLAISNIANDMVSVAYADVSTGKFLIEECCFEDIQSIIAKVNPSEIICSDLLLSSKQVLDSLNNYKSIIRSIPNSKLSANSISEQLTKFFGVKFLEVFGNLPKTALESISTLIWYLQEVFKSDKVNLDFPKLLNSSDYMYLDNFTRKSLELTTSLSENKKSTLFFNIDKTQTSQGSRSLARWLMEPLVNIAKINKRLDFVEFFTKKVDVLIELLNLLSKFPDVERSISRVLINKSGPRDLKSIGTSLKIAKEIGFLLSKYPVFEKLKLEFEGIDRLINELDSALLDDLPLLARDGNFIKKGYDAKLDEYIDILENGGSVIKSLQSKYVSETGIPTLKIKNNSVIGYFVEVSPQFASKIPYTFIHRQSLATSLRYTTNELVEIANKIFSAESNAKQRELMIFEELIKKVAAVGEQIKAVSNNISFIDVISSFAQLALENNYVRPIINQTKTLKIVNGRHPVVELSLKKAGEQFTRNPCEFSEDNYISILTGPNMGGKSTYLRQNAIIIIMAQIGSFVPADYAEIGVVDRIFSRVGASDDISSGRSTFMVEMIETATILRHATKNSFVILDEIGRGTSTYDGLAIAWAVIEEIEQKIKARTIFATHYHELKDLENKNNVINFLNVKVEEWNGKIVFLHKIMPGFADKSYGINVAALAGFPESVLNRAEELLKHFN